MPAKIAAALALSLALVTPATQALDNPVVPAQAHADRYVLNIDERGPGSQALIDGNYELAIQRARRASRLGQPVSAYLTLCAGYVASGDFARAEPACDRAVVRANAPKPSFHQAAGRPDRLGLAMAFSNRGVLRSLTGDEKGAEKDFARALKQDRLVDVVKANQSARENSARIASVD